MPVPTINTNEYLSTAEAATTLDVDVDTVRRYCANHAEGKTPAIEGIQVGRSWLIHKATLKEFIAERRGKGRPKSE